MFWSICFYFVLFACLSHGQTASCQVLSNELVLHEVLNGMKGCQPVSARFKYISLTSKELCDLRVVHNFVESPSDVAVVVVVQAKLPSSQHRPTLSHKLRPCLPQYLTRLLHQVTKCHHVRAALWLARLHRMRFKKAEKKQWRQIKGQVLASTGLPVLYRHILPLSYLWTIANAAVLNWLRVFDKSPDLPLIKSRRAQYRVIKESKWNQFLQMGKWYRSFSKRQLRFQELDLCPASLAVQNPELDCCCGSSHDSLVTLVPKAFPQTFKGPVGVPPCFRAYILSLTSLTRYTPYIFEGFLGVSTASKIALLHSSVILSWQQIKVG